MNLPNSEVEGVRVGLFGVVRPIGDVEYVEDRVCTFASEPDWLGAGADEDEFDLVGDLTRSLDTFVTQLPGRFPAQILPGHRCCRLVERVKLARDLEDDIHALEAIRIPRSIEDADADRRRPTLERAAISVDASLRGISHGVPGGGLELVASLDTPQAPREIFWGGELNSAWIRLFPRAADFFSRRVTGVFGLFRLG